MQYLQERHFARGEKDFYQKVQACIVKDEIQRWANEDLVPVHEMPVVVEELINLGEVLLDSGLARSADLRSQLRLLDLLQDDVDGRVAALQRVAKVIWRTYEDADWKVQNPLKVKTIG